jgi:hypothetical protein
MENQFNHALNGIRMMMTEIESIRKTGPVDENVIADFRQRLAIEILTFKRAAMFMRQQTDNERPVERLMHDKLDELLEIMGSPHPEFVKAGFYVSPNKPADPLYFWAYQDLSELGEWIQESCIHHASVPVPLPQAYQAIVRHEFLELMTVADQFREKDVNEKLVETLMHPFSRFQSPRPTGLMYRELVNLRRLKTAILNCSEFAGEKLEYALYTLLYEFNVNTDASVAYCKAYLRNRVNNAGSVDDRLEVVALEEKMIGQVTVKRNIGFDHFNDPLQDEMLNYLTKEYNFQTRRPELSTSSGATVPALPDTQATLTLAVTNEQHAAQMRVMQSTGYFKEKEKAVIEVTGHLVVSSKSQKIGMPTYRTNFYRPTAKAVMDVWNFVMAQIGWMLTHWGPRAYGIPDLEAMDAHDVKAYLLSFRKPKRPR